MQPVFATNISIATNGAIGSWGIFSMLATGLRSVVSWDPPNQGQGFSRVCNIVECLQLNRLCPFRFSVFRNRYDYSRGSDSVRELDIQITAVTREGGWHGVYLESHSSFPQVQ